MENNIMIIPIETVNMEIRTLGKKITCIIVPEEPMIRYIIIDIFCLIGNRFQALNKIPTEQRIKKYGTIIKIKYKLFYWYSP